MGWGDKGEDTGRDTFCTNDRGLLARSLGGGGPWPLPSQDLGKQSSCLHKVSWDGAGTAEGSDKDETKLKALFKLSDILDLEDKSSVRLTQLTGIQFQGFSDKQLEEVERPKEIENG